MMASRPGAFTAEKVLARAEGVLRMGNEEVVWYTVVITNHRTVVSPSGQAAGADVDALARVRGGFVIPHAAVTRLKFRNGFLGCFLTFEYRGAGGRRRKDELLFTLPRDPRGRGKAAGHRRRDDVAEYGRPFQDALLSALPSGAAGASSWDR